MLQRVRVSSGVRFFGVAVRNIRWPRTVLRAASRGRTVVAVGLLATLAGSCVLTNEDNPRRPPDVFDQVRAIDLLPRFPQQTGTTTVGNNGTARPATYYGEQQVAAEKPNFNGAQPAPSGEGYDLNFE